MTRSAIVILLAVASGLGTAVWDKAPEKWNMSDVFHILQDSPWSPTEVRVESRGDERENNSRSGMPALSPINSQASGGGPAMQIGQSKPAQAVTVLWWSSKTVRLAELRKKQLESGGKDPLTVDALPDYVLVAVGSEPYRILHDAKEDAHDLGFLEIPDGGTIDLESVKFVEGSGREEPRVEFHFAREVDGQATLGPDVERVIFHCKATAKTPRPTENNALAFRAEFKVKLMRVRGEADL
jgi:hypothetical protein